jgi:hypothetical protein
MLCESHFFVCIPSIGLGEESEEYQIVFFDRALQDIYKRPLKLRPAKKEKN